MGTLTDDISTSIFRRTVSALSGQISMSSKMLDLLIQLDGHSTVGEVSRKMNLTLSEVRPYLTKMKAAGLIEEVEAYLEPTFLGYLVSRLSRIAGPIARMMVEDAVLSVGQGAPQVPRSRGPELIEMLAQQIPDQRKKAKFIQEMLRKLNERRS